MIDANSNKFLEFLILKTAFVFGAKMMNCYDLQNIVIVRGFFATSWKCLAICVS